MIWHVLQKVVKCYFVPLPRLSYIYWPVYFNIVKITTGKHPTKLGTLASRISEKEIVAISLIKFKNLPSITNIKNEFRPTAELNIKAVTVDQINKIIRSLDVNKATGPDEIPVKVVKMSTYIIDKHLTNTMNNDL